MTVFSMRSRADPFVGNGKATAFPFDFPVYDPKHLEILQTDTSERETVRNISKL
ncbi:MAG: hypothetical protein FD153_729 [Rhodospirillaceae bacterium]|nr:MAG: hypothetical protein FD153_729 [Rhodospirillaceae bacterium]